MKFITTSIVLLISFLAYAQNNKIDSLKTALSKHTAIDTERVDLIISYTGLTINDSLDNSLPLLNEAIEIAQQLKYKKGEGLTYNVLSSLYIAKTDLEKALSYSLKSSELLAEIEDYQNLLMVNTNIARIYNIQKKYDKALEIDLKAINIIKNDPDSPGKARFYFYTGKTYDQLLDLKNAEIYYLEAKRIAEAINFEMGIAIANGSLGHLYVKMNSYQKALLFINKSLEYSEKHNKKSTMAASYKVLGDIYFGMKDYQKAIYYNIESIKIFKELNNSKVIAELYLNQSQAYDSLKKYQESNAYLKKHFILNDSLLSIEKTIILEDAQTKYEVSRIQSEKELAKKEAIIAQQESQENRNYLIGSILILVLLLISFFSFIQKSKTKKKAELIALELSETKKRLDIEKLYRKSELKALKAQMNPHFIFNALNSIQDLVLKGKKEESYNYITSFANMVRSTLNYSDKEFIDFEDEINLLTVYLELELLRFKKDFEFSIETNGIEDIQIPPMIIQPFIENALKHGLLHKENQKKLSITFKKDALLTCTIIDNGIGRVKAQAIKDRQLINHQSFSVNATKNRFEILKDTYQQDFGVEYIDMEDDFGNTGTKVILKMPYKRLY